MEAGERGCMVAIQQLVEERGASRAPIERWVPFIARVWMSRMAIDPIRADYGEKFIAHQVVAQPQTIWEMGYRADMDPLTVNVAKTRRLVYLGRPYNIVAADLIGHREGIELIAIADGGA
jgi:hypothetical protein